ncbi:pentapeptide repeat-containing protein [Nostoc sp.]|uniref:pentapeptide repeat-containing protein n=1 Tax=Nostoc sp. TaxID=1180 RepID=UPI002FFCA8E0
MVWKITPEELLERYADGERNFAGIELVYSGWPSSSSKYSSPGIDLDGVVLRDINLRGAYFDQVYLTGVDLTGADLGGIFMNRCNLVEGIIRDANLCAANLRQSGFFDADLRGTDLDYMNASGAGFRGVQIGSFERAILAYTDFEGAHISSNLICRGQNLIWHTTMPDGNVVEGPQWGNGRDAR